MKKIREREKNKNSKVEELKVKSQAAMEYLMTYGWAILVIALSLVVLYSLGIMNPKNFIPRAPPGSCFVFRPNGPGTTDFVSLQGTCGYLPMYAASFDGVSGCVVVLNWNSQPLQNAVSFEAWINFREQSRNYILYHASNAHDLEISNGYLLFYLKVGGSVTYFSSVDTLQPNRWYNVVGTYDSTSHVMKIYINGRLNNQKTLSGLSYYTLDTSSSETLYISYSSQPYTANGSIANVQIYNTALTDQEIQYLYQQGLGGGPVRLQNLVAWWPLNGDAKDYSGNNLHGTIKGGVTFVQNYNPP
jgi:hypothetical protein